MKIGVFGGTFNPIHYGHLNLARSYADLLGLDKMLIIPTNIPPHKRPKDLADGEKRLEMCRLACADDPVFEVSDLELRRPGSSYTVDTVLELEKQYPGAVLYLIVGSDMFLTFESWYRFEEILKRAVLCAGAREPGEQQKLERQRDHLANRYGANCILTDLEVIRLSSTEVRRMIRSGRSVGRAIPEVVCDYICRWNLYQEER